DRRVRIQQPVHDGHPGHLSVRLPPTPPSLAHEDDRACHESPRRKTATCHGGPERVGFVFRPAAEETTTMSMRASLVEAMHLQADSDTVHRINESGLAVADQETMSQAIHDVYCGIMADHHEP